MSLKRKYAIRKSLPKPFDCPKSGVYAILNRDNGKIYIGSAVRLNHRWTEHRCELEEKTHGNRYLQKAFSKNPKAFYIEVIEECSAEKVALLAREQFWINFFKSYIPANGYNIAPKAESCRGVKHTAEAKRKMSESHRAPWTEERKSAWREIRKRTQPRGWKWSSEARKRLSEAHKISKKHKRRPVIQLTLDGKFIRRFETGMEAELLFSGKIGGSICKACQGKRRKSAYGFIWKYEEVESGQ